MANGIGHPQQKRLEQFIEVPYNYFNNLSANIKFLVQFAVNNTAALDVVIQAGEKRIN